MEERIMTTKRINSDGTIDLIGERCGTLMVTGTAARAGNERRFTTRCERCGSQGFAKYLQLRNESARCLNASCGKVAAKRERLEESERIAAQRQAELDAAQRDAANARMDAESEGWERPLSLAEREGRKLRERRDQEARAEREAVEAPRREAEQRRISELQAEQQNTIRQIYAAQRERVANGKDDDFVIDPATLPGEGRKGIPQEKVAEWQQAQFDEFLRMNLGYHKCDDNAKALVGYVTRNAPGIVLISAAQLTAAYTRLNEFDLLKRRPVPQQSVKQPEVNLTVEPANAPIKPQPVIYQGFDLETGEPRTHSEREIGRMSSEQMKRALQMQVRGELELPRTGPGPMTRKQRGLV
jgi:hypothetical protein